MPQVQKQYKNLKEIDTGLMVLRISHPEEIKKIKASMEKSGQHQPVVVRQDKESYQLLDGFKRYFAAEQLGMEQLEVKIIDVPETTGMALMISYNRNTRGLADYEEALIVQNLHIKYLMTQQDISSLLGYSSAWVCRRLALIERLDKSVQESLRMGQITSGHARGLVKLPRGNQQQFLSKIIGHNLTTGQARLFIDKYLQSNNKEEAQWVITHPQEAIANSVAANNISDNRLTVYGNRLLKSIMLLALQQQIFIGQYTNYQKDKLTVMEIEILSPKVSEILKKSKNITNIIENNQL